MLLSFSVFVVALLWGTLDVLRKHLSQVIPPMPLVLALTLGHIPFFSVWLVYGGDYTFHIDWFYVGIANIVLSILSLVMFIKSLKISPISQTIPLLSLAPVFSSLIGYFFLDENLSLSNQVGILFIVLGAIKLHAQFQLQKLIFKKDIGALLMIGVAFLWSVLIVLDKLGLQHTNVPFHGLFMALGISALVVVYLTLNKDIFRLKLLYKDHILFLLISTLVMASAMGLQLWVVKQMNVGVVEGCKRGISMVMAIICGQIFFDEEIHASQILSIAIMIIGVGLVVLL
jgi:drug/metabolite transporter (DMT)-like permease